MAGTPPWPAHPLALGELAKQGRAPLTRALGTAKRPMLVLMVWTAAVSLGSYMVVGFLPTYLIRVARLTPTDAYAASLVAVTTLAASSRQRRRDALRQHGPVRVRLAGLHHRKPPGFYVLVAALAGLLAIAISRP